MKNAFNLVVCCSVFLFGSVAQAQSPFTFTNANSKFASTNFHSGNAVSVVDMDGDGLDDIARLDGSDDLYYTLQRINETFNNIHAVSVGSGNAWAMVVGDVNNDGTRDVAAGYNGSAKLVTPNTALTSFPIVTLTHSDFFLQNMNFADVNNDGWLDLFGCNDNATSRIWGNNGAGAYGDTTQFFNLTNPGTDGSGNYGSIWTDIDNDGDIDFYISHCRQNTGATDGKRLDQLFINNGNMQFTLDAAAVPGARGLRNYAMTWTSSFEDIDNDGDLDCVLTETDVNSQLFLNNGSGYFTEITAGSGFVLDITPYQSKMEDLDNDGYVDIIISGDDSRVFHNNHDNTFTRIDSLFDNNNMLSFATGDLNHDGQIDLYSTYGNVYNSPTGTDDVLWMNTNNNGNHFVTFDLQGTLSNRDALGARVEIYGAWGKQIREVRSGESYGTTNSFMCHFGTGTATTIDSAIIRWPKGLVTKLYNRAADQFIKVIEGQCSSPDNIVSITGPTVLCTGQSANLSAPAGYTYLWNTGETTQSINASSTGDFAVKVSDNGCGSISKVVPVLLLPDETPTITALGSTVFCEGSSVVLQGTPAVHYLWSNGDTTQTTTASQAGNYTLTIEGTCANFTSAPFTIAPIPSHISAVTPASVCDNTATALSVGVSPTGTAYWYDAATGGNLVTSGASYTTPTISDTIITYYVESHDTLFGLSGAVGPGDNTIGAGGNYNINRYQIFTVYKQAIIKEVTVYASGAGNRTIELRNSSGTVLQSTTVNLPNGQSVVTLNFPVSPGTDYRLGVAGNTINMYRNSDGASYPYTIANLISITDNSASDPVRWYFYYNWQVEEQPVACTSTRTPVSASIHPQPSAPVSSSQPTNICPGDSVILSVPPDANSTFNWSNGATTPAITVLTSGTFDITVSNGYCDAISTPVTVTVSNNPVADVTASDVTTFCEGGSVELIASGGTAYLWSNNATTSSITVNASGTYTVTVALSGSCNAISNPTTVMVNPLPVVSMSGLNTQYYSNEAAVTLTGVPSGGTFNGAGVTGDSFDPAAAGVGGPYTVTYSYTDNNGCMANTSNTVTVLQAVGFATLEGISKVSVYPNPGNGQFLLSMISTDLKKIDIAITNSLGQKIYGEKDITVNRTFSKAMNLDNIAKGIYQLVITSGKKQAAYKLVIE